VLDDMRQRLHEWMQDTHDPLLHGAVPLPPGGVANDPDGRSPEEPPALHG
jgi:N-sulfoglucosamine sulfohydrolase